MRKYLNKNITIFLKNFSVFGFLFLIITKIFLIASLYSYAFASFTFWQEFYFFFEMIRSDLLIFWWILFWVRLFVKIKRRYLRIIPLLFVITLFTLYLWDLLIILCFQQRLLISSQSSLLSAWVNVILFYVLVFLLCIGFFVLLVHIVVSLLRVKVSDKWIAVLLILSFICYALPLPDITYLGANLPKTNIVETLLKTSYEIPVLSTEIQEMWEKKQELINVPEEEMQFLLKKKEWWYGLAHDDPERIFETFKTSSLTRLTDEYGNNYVYEILAESVKTRPELAFEYIDNYKDWKDEHGKTIVKDLLRLAIQYKPELAFSYLNRYQGIIIDHEKIAKSLLQYAAQIYKAPLTFQELFTEVEGRKNRSNVILLFLESASSVDSWKYGGLNNRLPWLDKVSDEGTSFLNMHANGMTSDMGHIATLLGVEPLEYGYKGTRYASFTGYDEPLASFFNNLWYSTTFLSTATLEFLDQRDFIKRVGYQEVIWEEAFTSSPKYTFNAAPDEALYDKALSIIQTQQSPYFLTMQTISSHTPYNTPYGHTMEDMYRYEDDAFSEFYKKLKETNFFNNWILIVIGDHRKMTPLEDNEFEKWGTTAASKIIWFMIGKGIPVNKLANGIYQQTDLFYSLLHEFWSWTVNVLENYNDLFSKEIARKWSLKQWYQEKKMNISDTEGHEWVIDLNRMKIMNWEEYFPGDDILNYVKLSMDYQWSKQGNTEENPQNSRMLLISHRGNTKTATENSLNAFKSAYNLWADGLEFDITATKDWEILVYHGPKLYGQTQCKDEQRDICELSYEEVKNCLLNDGQSIMKLEEMLPEIKNWFWYIFIDYKVAENENCNQNKQEIFERAVKLVQKYKMDAKVVFSSYDKEIARSLSKRWDLISAFDTYSLSELDEIPWSYYSYFMTPAANFTDTLVQRLQRYMIDGVAYTVNDGAMLKKLKNMGVRFVMTDEIEKMKEILKEQK